MTKAQNQPIFRKTPKNKCINEQMRQNTNKKYRFFFLLKNRIVFYSIPIIVVQFELRTTVDINI